MPLSKSTALVSAAVGLTALTGAPLSAGARESDSIVYSYRFAAIVLDITPCN